MAFFNQVDGKLLEFHYTLLSRTMEKEQDFRYSNRQKDYEGLKTTCLYGVLWQHDIFFVF